LCWIASDVSASSIQDVRYPGWKFVVVANGAPERLLDTREAER
jgi:hypothetical protein